MKFQEVIPPVSMKFLLTTSLLLHPTIGDTKRYTREAKPDPQFGIPTPFLHSPFAPGPFLGHGPPHHPRIINDPFIHDPIIHDPLVFNNPLANHIIQGQFQLDHVLHDQFHQDERAFLESEARAHPNAAAAAAAAAGLGVTAKPSFGLAPNGACGVICSILDLLIFNPDFSTLISAIKAADLVDTLALPGPITLFAPTNEAFEHLDTTTFNDLLSDKDKLRALLLRHVSKGELETVDLPSGSSTLITGAGERVTIASLPLGVSIISTQGSSNVIDADVKASNGIIHVVDAVF